MDHTAAELQESQEVNTLLLGMWIPQSKLEWIERMFPTAIINEMPYLFITEDLENSENCVEGN